MNNNGEVGQLKRRRAAAWWPSFVLLALGALAGCRSPVVGRGLPDSALAVGPALPEEPRPGVPAVVPAPAPEGRAGAGGRRFDPVTIQLEEAQPLGETRYFLPSEDFRLLRARVADLVNQPWSLAPGGEQIFYSVDIAHMDSWLPHPGTPQTAMPADDYVYRWHLQGGRTVLVEGIDHGQARPEYQVWYDERGAPVLSVYVGGERPESRRYAWADYDPRGLLCRVVEWYEGNEPVRVQVHLNSPGYESSTIYWFDAEGQLTHRTRYSGDDLLLVTLPDPQERRVNGGSRVSWLRSYEQYGFASLYPIPPAQ